MRRRRNVSPGKVIALAIIGSFVFALIYIATLDIEISTSQVEEDISGQLFKNER